jgi:outer membrane protein assembly factor BamB
MSPKCSLLYKSSRLIFVLVLLVADCLTGRSAVSGNDNSLTFVDANAGKVYAQVEPGHFIAIDGETGSVLWSFRDPNLRLFTKAVFRSDALFVAATGSNSNSELIRLDLATGKADWRALIEGLGGNGSPVLCAGEVLESDYWHKTVSAFNVLTGKKDWTTESQPFLFLFPPAVLDDRALFLVADKNAPESKQLLMSISCRDGRPVKALPVQIEGVSRTPVLLYKESAVLSGYDKIRGTSLAATRMSDGTQIWSALIPDEIARFTPAIQNNLLIAGAASLWVVDLDTGKITFHEALPTPTVPVAAKDGLAFSSRGSQTIEARELPSGKLRWSAKLRGRISSNIAMTDSHVYVKTGEAQLAALKMTGEVDRYLQIGKSGGSASGTLH